MVEIAVATLLAALFADSQKKEEIEPLLMTGFKAPPGSLFHVRVMDPDAPVLDRLTFDPRIPKGMCYEDRTCPRVCFSTSLPGAFVSIGLGLRTLDDHGFPVRKRVDVYTNAKTVLMGEPSSIAVPDAGYTGELWALEPVQLQLRQIIDPKKTEQLAEAQDGAADSHAMSMIHLKYQEEEQSAYTWSTTRRDLMSGPEVAVHLHDDETRLGGATAIEWGSSSELTRELARHGYVAYDHWTVDTSGLHDSVQGQGLGKQLYRRLLNEVATHGPAYVHNDASGGRGTSPKAMRIWQGLLRDYPGVVNKDGRAVVFVGGSLHQGSQLRLPEYEKPTTEEFEFQALVEELRVLGIKG